MISSLRPWLASLALVLLTMQSAFAADEKQPLKAGDIEIFYGVIPAEIILGHPAGHEERRMHGGVPAWGEQYHLIVTLFDGTTRQRIRDAEVQATVFDVRSPGKRVSGPRKQLEPMLFGGAASYGNYFNMPSSAPYRIELEIRRHGAMQTVRVPLNYRHALITRESSP